MSKMETFSIEAASRRSVKELVDALQKQWNDTTTRTANLEAKMKATEIKLESNSMHVA